MIHFVQITLHKTTCIPTDPYFLTFNIMLVANRVLATTEETDVMSLVFFWELWLVVHPATIKKQTNTHTHIVGILQSDSIVNIFSKVSFKNLGQ